MKKLLSIILLLFVMFSLFTNADWFKTITLSPWWNVVSTPWILSSVIYSNWWAWLSFFKLVWWKWQSVAWNITNLRPTYWFLVNNNNSNEVIMSLRYSPQTVMWATFTDNVTAWWNLFWITDNSSLYAVGWEITVDFTNNWITNLLNKVNDNYTTRYSNGVYNAQIWEAYWVYVRNGKEYWWVNNPVWDPISCKTNYSTKKETNQNVIVTLTECTWGEIILNWDSYTFTENWDHIFEYRDIYGNEWKYTVTVNRIDRTIPTCSGIIYSPSTPTNQYVVAYLTGCDKTLSWTYKHRFDENWEYVFEYYDLAWNKNQKTAMVNWIDKQYPECEFSYSPSTYTTWPVILQLTCNEKVKFSYSYTWDFANIMIRTYTWNIVNQYVGYCDIAWNSTWAYITINRIQSETTLEESQDIYMNTLAQSWTRVMLLSGRLMGENKNGSAKYTVSSGYKLHIRNTQPWTPLKNLLSRIELWDCVWESNNYIETDQNWNVDVNLDFDCSSQSAMKLPKDIIMYITLASSVPQWATFYVDDIDKNNLIFTDQIFVVTSWKIQSRIINVWDYSLNLSSNELIKSIKRWDYILVYDWEISTTANRATISEINIYSHENFNDKIDLKLYIWDELKWEKTQKRDYSPDIPDMWITKFWWTTIYSWQSKSIKIYWKISESIPVWTYFTPTVRIDSASDENGISFKELPTVTRHSFLVYDIYRFLDIQKTDNITSSSFGSETRNRLIFKWVLSSSSEDDIRVSSLKLTNDNDTFDWYIRFHFYIDWELIWEWLLENWVFSVNTNYIINRNKAYLFEIYADTVCKVPNPATLNQTISIWAATQWWNPVPSDRLPSVQWWTFTMWTNLWNYGCSWLWND